MVASIHFVFFQYCGIVLIFVHSAWNQFYGCLPAGTIHENLYYAITIKVDKASSDKYWSSDRKFLVNDILSQSHRRAVDVALSFDFPFYGNPVRNVKVTSGGFLHIQANISDTYLASTDYVAPLMMNFDGRLSNVTSVKYADNGSEFTVIWEKVPIQNKETEILQFFTFSATIYVSGDITFAYRVIPEPIETFRVHEEVHPLQIGLSDSYIIQRLILVFKLRREMIYEYDRVSFNVSDITNDTLIYMKAKPTCLQHIDCQTCVSHSTETFNNFNCTWCPAVKRCSSGFDRKRSEWVDSGCLDNSIVDIEGCAASKSLNGV